MRHPTEGVLRRLVDEPAGVTVADRAHVGGCEACHRTLAAIRDDAALVRAALEAPDVGTHASDLDLAAGWQRLSTATSTAERGSVVAPQRTIHSRAGRFRAALRRPAVAGIAVAVVLVGAGAAAANDWLEIFRTEQIVPIDLSIDDLNALPDLSAYGEFSITGDPDRHQVSDAAAAGAETGLDVPETTTLPRGVSGEPEYQVVRELSANFTFSADRAARAAATEGAALPPPPPGLDGSQLRMVAGPGVAQIWSQPDGIPELVVGRAVAPTAFSSSDIPFRAVRDYLLSLPGLPADVASSLRSFNADRSTLPLPVPADRVTTSPVHVKGVSGTMLTTRDHTLAAVLWVDDGVVTVVAGPLDGDELLSVARGLQ